MSDGRMELLAAHMRELGQLRRLVKDLKSIGVVAEICLGCGKTMCGGCPAGTATAINPASLSDEAKKKHEDLAKSNDA